MAKRASLYKSAKRKKELLRQKKQEEKRLRRQQKRAIEEHTDKISDLVEDNNKD